MNPTSMPRYCRKCGKALMMDDNSIPKFCRACGANIFEEENSPRVEIKKQTNVYDEARLREIAYERAKIQLKEDKDKREKELWDKILKISGIVCGIAVLLIICFFLLKLYIAATCFIGLVAIYIATLAAVWNTYSERKNPTTHGTTEDGFSILFGLFKYKEVQTITSGRKIKDIWSKYALFVGAVFLAVLIAIMCLIS